MRSVLSYRFSKAGSHDWGTPRRSLGGSIVAWGQTQSVFSRWLKGSRDGNDLP